MCQSRLFYPAENPADGQPIKEKEKGGDEAEKRETENAGVVFCYPTE